MPAVGLLPDLDPYSMRLRHEYGLTNVEVTDEQIRTARHGYYGSVAYCDDLVGGLLQTLRDTGLEDNTVIVFSTDHGDMMGERGLWYKRTFFEGASRIPFMISWPQRFAPGRVGANTSLVDLLPTLLDLAGGTVEPVDTMDGTSLVPLCDNPSAESPDLVFGEHLSEASTTPILMAKRGSMKYAWSAIDPPQLFDLSTDPHELVNLATDASHAETVSELDAIVHQRWDAEQLAADVLESQRRRTFLRSLYAGGKAPEWRTPPPDQAAQRVLAEGEKYNDWAYDTILA